MKDAQALAAAVAAAIVPNEPLFARYGIALAEIGPGFTRLTMSVRDDMLNAQGVCHGGVLFTLADSALGIASNSYNQRALAAGCAIEFVRPAKAGEELIASAREQGRAGRTCFYDVRVETASGELIALFRGRTVTVAGHVVPGQD